MKKIIKRFFILFLCLTLSIASYTKQRANAVALVDDVVIAGGVTVSTSAILALAGTTLVAGGVVLDSTFNDSEVCKYVVSKMIATGETAQYLSVKVLESGKQFLTWTQSGINWFCDTFQSSVVSPSLSLDGSVVSFNSKPFSEDGVYYRYFDLGTITVPVDTNISFDFVGSAVVSLQALTTYYMRISQHYKGSWNIQFSVSPSFSNYSHSGMIPVDVSSVCMSEKPIPSDSICPTPRDAVKNWDSSSAQDVIGGALDGAYNPNVGVPLTGGSVGALNPAIDYPYGKTWDDLFPDISIPKDTDTDVPDVDVPSDTVFDKVIDSIKDLTDSISDSIDKIFDMPVGATPSLDFSPLMIATMKFPFCIPWDLFRCVEVFNSGEETFKYEFKEVKYSDTDIIIIPNFKVDFSTIPYVDTLRKVFKFIMYISYCVFLICKIRGLMRS